MLTDASLTAHAHILTFDHGPESLKGVVDKEMKNLVIGMDPRFIEKVREACWAWVEYIGQSGAERGAWQPSISRFGTHCGSK